jgi:HK97 family phage major capsid protein
MGLINGSSYELGISEIAGDKYTAPQLRGHSLPTAAMSRDLGVGIASAGGNLAGTELAAVSAAVRPQLVLDQLGAERLEVSGAAQLDLPRFSGGAGSWIAEGEAASSMATTVASATAMARCAAARIGLSRRVMNGNPRDVEGAVLAEVRRAVADVIQSGFINGSGSNAEPLGIVRVPGIGSKSYAGSTPTMAEISDQIEIFADADGDLRRASWLLHPSDAAALMAATISANGGETIMQWQDGAHRICGLPVAISSNVPEGTHIVGDFSTVQMVFFGSPQLIADRFSGGKVATGALELVLLNYCDCVLRSPQHVVVGAG